MARCKPYRRRKSRKITCRGKSRSRCNRSSKSCKYVSGTKRKYCRKRRSVRKH